jgi:ribosome-associated heat shock protein Hsp15
MSKQHNNAERTQDTTANDSMRVDKWLWVARFFKTRSLAKAAIEGGKVHHAGDRVKVSKEIRVGMELSIMQGFEKKTVIVQAMASTRGPAPVAQQLYSETEVSLARRELIASQRKLNNLARHEHRPNKRDRRQYDKFQAENSQHESNNWSYYDD